MAKIIAKADSVKLLNARSVELAKSVKEIGKEIVTHCVDIMLHIEAHRDVTPAEFFLSRLMVKQDKENHSIVRSDAVKKWLARFAFVTFSESKPASLNKGAFNKANANPDKTDFANVDFKDHNAVARANPWNKYTPEPGDVTTPFDIEKAIMSAVEALEKRREAAIKHEGSFARQTAKARESNVVSSPMFDQLLAIRDAIKVAKEQAAKTVATPVNSTKPEETPEARTGTDG